jgi:hypothetical protein
MALLQARPHVTASKPRSPAGRVASVAQPPLAEYYSLPLGAFCQQHWRPAKTPGKVMIGASGANYGPAMADLGAAGLPAPLAIEQAPLLSHAARSPSPLIGPVRTESAEVEGFLGILAIGIRRLGPADVRDTHHRHGKSELQGRAADLRAAIAQVCGVRRIRRPDREQANVFPPDSRTSLWEVPASPVAGGGPLG